MAHATQKGGAHEEDLFSLLCAHIQMKCEAVEIDLLDCLIVKLIILTTYSRDPKSNHSKTGPFENQTFLSGFRMEPLA